MSFFGPSWGGESEYDPHERQYGAEEGSIVLEHEGELALERRSGESMPVSWDLGGGIVLRINPDYFRMIMHSPEVTAMVDQRCEELCNEANSIKIIDAAEYVYQVSNNQSNIRARGRVKTGNYAARVDNNENGTLLKALATVGSDPLPPQYAGNEAYERYLGEHDEFHSMYAGEEAHDHEPAEALAEAPMEEFE
jgi:hypothetical protein